MANVRTLVLNADYQAVGVISTKRAFSLVLQDKAQLVTNYENQILRSAKDEWSAPSIIRLRKFVKIPFRSVPLTRHGIYKRDGNCCVYCGSKQDLTLDHVFPKSKGGKDSWENLVTSCGKCNREKGDILSDDLGEKFQLKKKPSRPSLVVYLKNSSGITDDEKWRPYLYH